MNAFSRSSGGLDETLDDGGCGRLPGLGSMPGMSGAEVARQIRALHPDQPILFVSGYSETEAVKRTAPNAPLLAKPFRADALQKAVRGALTPAG